MNKEYKYGAILSYTLIFLGNIIGIIYTPIMLRMLGQAEYGLYSLVGSIIVTFSLIDLGFGNACIRYVSKYRALGNKYEEFNLNGLFLIINIILSIITIFVGLIFFTYIENIFSNSLTISELQSFKIMFIILIINLSLSFPLSIFSSIITSYERFIFPKILLIIRTLLNPIIILCILSFDYGAVEMVIAHSILNLFFNLFNVYYCVIYLKTAFMFKSFNKKLIKEISIYSLFIFIGIIVDKIYWSTGQIVLGVYSGTLIVSIYAIASQFNMYYMQFSTAISGMFLPRLTTMVTNKTDSVNLTDIFIKVGRIQFSIIALVFLLFLLFGKEFIGVWAGIQYTDAYVIALILIGPYTIPLIQNIGLSILQAKNLHKFRSSILLLIAIGNLIISIPLIKGFGGIGAATATAISMIIGNIFIMNFYYHIKLKINIPKFWYEIGSMCVPMLPVLLFGILLNSILPVGILCLIIKILLFISLYCTSVYFWGLKKYEQELLSSPFRKLFNIIINFNKKELYFNKEL
ncbi:oligosaccharide flippase family protein [Metabacillus indicus]|uniref:Uncharacterized protein n=1 Tax=Metabacillus indicus TaxID=246786 RepID=A0A084H4G9_METID|nr:oligosaccharide flippase family protein [Metabacillus indicus]KEZ50325.1 hypothetical protein AZ46_0206465 [Metabacillus indicus LMG 22858]KEZ54481.1 hypothetical protein GS18_0206140 [Metabacillus indicus]